jgi:hypothetical protein
MKNYGLQDSSKYNILYEENYSRVIINKNLEEYSYTFTGADMKP